jgi:hypothetical protein
MHPCAVHLDRLGVEIDGEIASLNDRVCVSLGSSHDGVDARDQLVFVERFGHVVVGAKAETFDLVVDSGKAGKDQDWRLHPGNAQLAQHVEARHIRQVQIKEDNVVVVDFAEEYPMTPSNTHDPAGAGSSDDLRGLEILLVEDSWSVGEAMGTCLSF